MKFKLLTDTELKELENDFVQFLIVNHIYKEEWEELNKKDPVKALSLVELFSDVVYEKALSKIKYLEHIAQDKVKVFYFTETKAVLIGIDSINGSIDKDDWKNQLSMNVSNYEIWKVQKDYPKENRSLEIFKLMEIGAVECTKETFDSVSLLLK